MVGLSCRRDLCEGPQAAGILQDTGVIALESAGVSVVAVVLPERDSTSTVICLALLGLSALHYKPRSSP